MTTRRQEPKPTLALPTWAILYLILLAALTAWSTVDDARKAYSISRLVADVAAAGVLAVLFAAYFLPTIDNLLGRASLPLFAVAFAWTAISVHRDIAAMEPDPELSARANLIAEHVGIVLGVLAASPAIAFAALAVIRHW